MSRFGLIALVLVVVAGQAIWAHDAARADDGPIQEIFDPSGNEQEWVSAFDVVGDLMVVLDGFAPRFHVFARTGGVWSIEETIDLGFASHDSVATDGHWIVVTRNGNLKLFEDPGSGWVQSDTVVVPEGTGHLSMSGDHLVVVLSDSSVGDLHSAGSLHPFRLVGGEWVAGDPIHSPTPTESARYGETFAHDGDTLIVGRGDFLLDVYTWDGTDWVLDAVLDTTAIGHHVRPGPSVVGDRIIVPTATGSRVIDKVAGNWEILGAIEPVGVLVGESHIVAADGYGGLALWELEGASSWSIVASAIAFPATPPERSPGDTEIVEWVFDEPFLYTSDGGPSRGEVIRVYDVTPLCGGLPPTITGTPGNDILVGTDGDDVIVGLGGDDFITGLDGDDKLCGGAGDDIIDGGLGDDLIDGSLGHDEVRYSLSPGPVSVNLSTGSATGAYGNDTLLGINEILGSPYDDSIIGTSGADVLDGAGGDDLIDGMGGVDTLIGGAGTDTISLASFQHPSTDGPSGYEVDLLAGVANRIGGTPWSVTGFENAIGSKYNDIIWGTNGANHIQGGAGKDRIYPRGENDVVSGGLGVDTLSYKDRNGPMTIDLRTGQATGSGTDSFDSFEVFEGSAGDDLMIGDDGANHLMGMAGDDEIYGRKGADILQGGNGDDLIDGGGGPDLIEGGNGDDFLVGGNGDDDIRGQDGADYVIGGRGADTMNGGAGPNHFLGIDLDTVSFEFSKKPMVIKMGKKTARGEGKDKIHEFPVVIGSRFDDIIHAPRDRLSLNILVGGPGDDRLFGYGDRDQLIPGSGNDILRGDGGMTYVDYQIAPNGVTVDLRAGRGTGWGNDTLIGIMGFIGSRFDDVATAAGLTVDVELHGLKGRDRLTGGSGRDDIFGGGGSDYGNGGPNTDRCVDVETRVSCEQVFTSDSRASEQRVVELPWHLREALGITELMVADWG